MGNISQDDRDRARKDWIKDHPGKEPDEKAINGQVYQNFYDKAFNNTGLGTGGAVQQGIQAATAAVQGLAGGDVAAALANGAAPYLAEVIGHRMGLDDNAKAIAHAIVGAALAAAQGQNAAAGATGAALGEITAGILKDQLYGDTPIADLTETQKQTLSALATLSSGLAGGLVGDSTGSAVYAAQAGKTTAENNFQGPITQDALDKAVEKQKKGEDLPNVSREILWNNNIDRHSNALLARYRQDKESLTPSELQQLAGYLNVYARELQQGSNFTAAQAQDAVNRLLTGGMAYERQAGYPGGGGDTSSYYKALGYQAMLGAQTGQAAVGNEAIMALPGVPGILVRASIAAGGSYQTGTGIGQMIDGSYSDGLMNIGAGSLAIFGSVAGQNSIKKTSTGIYSPNETISLPVSGRLTGKNIFPDNLSTISSENKKYVDILSPSAKQHILYGESLKGGGHMYPGNPGKTIFPPSWSADKIVHEVGDIATSPSTQWYAQTGTGGMYTSKGKPANWVSYEQKDGVRIRVVYQPAIGKVITAFPDSSPVPASYKPIKLK